MVDEKILGKSLIAGAFIPVGLDWSYIFGLKKMFAKNSDHDFQFPQTQKYSGEVSAPNPLITMIRGSQTSLLLTATLAQNMDFDISA